MVLLFIAAAQAQAGGPKGKKLIEFGWDEPNTTFLRTNLAQMQRIPFDGCVFHVNYRRAGSQGSFTWEGWGTNAFSEGDLREAFADLRATPFGPFNGNFLRFNATPGKLDWFDDHTATRRHGNSLAGARP